MFAGLTQMVLRHIRALLPVLIAACGFPRPADVGDDVPTGAACVRDQDCGGLTPFCSDAVCVTCKASTSCPASRPVCDTTSHDCRTCAKDSECDSGACDLAAGTCVNQGAILYASSTGSNADPCTRTSPCALRHATSLVDTAHAYIVLMPGRYAGFAGFGGQTATIVGNNATIAFTEDGSDWVIINGSSITMQDIHIEEHLTPAPDISLGVITITNSKLVIDNMQSDTGNLSPIYGRGGDTVTVRRSNFIGHSVHATRLVADGCFFHNGGPSVEGSIELTNSVIIADPTMMISLAAIQINSSGIGNPNSKVVNNTFVGGHVACSLSGSLAQFTNNIFYNYTVIDVPTSCVYQYNLVTPIKDLGGNGNTTGDPMFVDVAHDDVHLKAGSVAIDAADPALVSIDRDYDGMHRPQGTRSDIGAFEDVP